MAKKKLQELENLIKPVLEEDMELLDLEYVKEGPFFYLRVFIDKEGGLNIEDITNVTREINSVLDKEDPIEEQYFLEVSSPGLDRSLKKDRDFVREKGKEVEVKLYKPQNGKKTYEGRLVGLEEENGNIVIEAEEKRLSFCREDVAIVKLKIDF